MSSTKRIQKEIADITRNPSAAYTISPSDDDITQWTGQIKGPESSIYAGGKFQISVDFPTDFPFKPPVDHEGNICLQALKQDTWKPSYQIRNILEMLVSLLAQPNPDDPLDADIADNYVNNKAKFDQTAREYVKKYAQ
ncbi:hypothetical protein HDV04_002884 [Boothiomyces sp. JEL0838]|nr:hypothetical protein HDV04_002884 [Boothiomyces sp. JEL0838]